ncbi:MAG TPA: hypothetical protein DCM68_02235 [Verrucomicrobia bacterium]|nr:hypothetical protein [Verrucomicrobiota bacterium]
MKKKPLSTSLRAAIHATASTRVGCHANSAATNALRQREPVIRKSTQNKRAAFAACSRTFIRWCPCGPGPNTSMSAMYEIHNSGSHHCSCTVVNACLTASPRSPPVTIGLSIT